MHVLLPHWLPNLYLYFLKTFHNFSVKLKGDRIESTTVSVDIENIVSKTHPNIFRALLDNLK